jgi:alkylhydroperoxidase/carboxymuconolactone decarboxylase family protein YurZ
LIDTCFLLQVRAKKKIFQEPPMGSGDAEDRSAGNAERTVGFSSPLDPKPAKLPGLYRELIAGYPELAAAHDQMGHAAESCGPLDARSLVLVKIGMAVGAGLESGLRSHVRRAGEMGLSQEEITQAIFQGMTTLGFPRTMAAWSWAKVQWERDSDAKATGETDRGERVGVEPNEVVSPTGCGQVEGPGERSR